MPRAIAFSGYTGIIMWKKYFLPVLLALFCHAGFGMETVLDVVPLQNRPAAEIQPLLQPLLTSSDRVIADGTRLIVRAAPAHMQEIRKLIARLDRGMENLLIQVIQGRNISAQQLNARIQARIHLDLDDHAKSKAHITGNYYQTRSHDVAENTQTIRTLNGQPAHIEIGKLYSIPTLQIYQPGYGYPGIVGATTLIEASTGIAVLPRLTGKGDRVLISISPWSEQLQFNNQIDMQSAATTIEAKLGEWVEIGAIGEDSRFQQNGLSSRTYRSKRDNLHILLKVDREK